jgi:uncharacterized sulfatase
MITRRTFLKAAGICTLAGLQISARGTESDQRPNILFVISDDQSWPHAGTYGCQFVNTPTFDRVAKEGVLFHNAFAAAPQCSPNRASILTGRPIWSNREAGTHDSLFPADLITYTELLEAAGYHVGFSHKGWAPGNFAGYGRVHNPAGRPYRDFEAFLADRKSGQPFCFWWGPSQPHRPYQTDSGFKSGKDPAAVQIPAYLPDHDVVRKDLLDYAAEIEKYDTAFARLLDRLRATGEQDNTLLMVTGDNGMPFPRAKATLYEDGLHVPLAVRWPNVCAAGRTVDDLISHIDLAPTILEAAGVKVPAAMPGRSFLNVLRSNQSGNIDPARTAVFAGRERHTSARPDNVGYPARAIRTDRFLYIHNFKPDRWPMGDHQDDVDNGPTKSLLLQGKQDADLARYYELSFAKRPEHELYDVVADPACIRNLAYEAEHAQTRDRLWRRLQEVLREQQDPRVLGFGDIFESYPRFSFIRPIAGPDVKQGQYVQKFIQPGQTVPPGF